ncbi:MAG: SPOR domain-containing protein [Bacteroidales bacterium]
MEASSHTTPGSAPKKKSGRGLIIVLILIVLIAAGVVVFRKQIVPPVKEFISSLFHKKEMVVEPTEPRKDSIAVQDSMNFTEPLPSEQETSSLPAGKRYYIIAGSFVQEVNADKYVTKLQQQGYEATKIPRQKKNMFAVGCISYDSQKEALSQLNHYRNKVHPQAWVLGY